MRLRYRAMVLAVPLAAVTVVAGACGSGSNPSSQPVKKIDVNATPLSKVKSGGTLHWGVDQWVPQWNYSQINGTLKVGNDIESAIMPRLIRPDVNGKVTMNPDYVTSAKITSTKPHQVVTYELNPKAKWSDGTQITWKDFQTEWKALNGKNSAYEVSASQGYNRISNVKQGKNAHEVVVTFDKPFNEWKELFDPLYPAKEQSSPSKFNNAYKNKIPVTGGPFVVAKLDNGRQSVTLKRNPKWWGNKPKLDGIVFTAMDDNALPGAFANGEIDYFDMGANADAVKRVKSTKGATLHKAAGPDYRTFTFANRGALKDVRVRQAIAMAIDRKTITRSDLQGTGWPVKLMNNHFFVNTQKGYRNTAGAYGEQNVGKAKKLLTAAGWKMHGKWRTKNGKKLAISFVIPGGIQSSKQEAELTQSMESRIGVKVNITNGGSGDDFFKKYVDTGNFDIAAFSWIGTPFPITNSSSIYKLPTGKNVQQNYGRIGTESANNLMDTAAGTLDTAKARGMLNRADKQLWQQVHSVILYQRPQLTATSKGLANIGSWGFAVPQDYTKIGYEK